MWSVCQDLMASSGDKEPTPAFSRGSVWFVSFGLPYKDGSEICQALLKMASSLCRYEGLVMKTQQFLCSDDYSQIKTYICILYPKSVKSVPLDSTKVYTLNL